MPKLRNVKLALVQRLCTTRAEWAYPGDSDQAFANRAKYLLAVGWLRSNSQSKWVMDEGGRKPKWMAPPPIGSL